MSEEITEDDDLPAQRAQLLGERAHGVERAGADDCDLCDELIEARAESENLG